MARLKFPVFKMSSAIFLQLAIATGLSTLIQTPQALLAQEIPQRWQAQEYQVPSSIGVPGRRQQGGTRGLATCSQMRERLTALVPINSYGVTVAAYPTLWFYMPKMEPGTAALTVEFLLVDESNNNSNEIYKTTFQTAGKSGIIGISLPEEAGLAPLQLDKDYHWFFTLVCNPTDAEGNIVVDGRIRRVAPSAKLNSQLQQAEPKNKAKLYAQAEIWFDALTTLAELRRYNPTDSAAAAEWEKLLRSVDLEGIARESLVGGAIAPDRQLTSQEQ